MLDKLFNESIIISEEEKMRSFKYLILGILIIFLIGFTSNCDLGLFPKPPDDDDDNGEEECTPEELYPPTGDVGDTIESCHFDATLHSALRVGEYLGARARDQENNILVVLYATIKLTKLKEKACYIGVDCFKIKDGQGNIYLWDGLTSDDWIPQGYLSKNQEVSGSCIIEVPKSASDFIAIFFAKRDAETYKDQIKWNLGF